MLTRQDECPLPGLLIVQSLSLNHCRDTEGRPLKEGKAPAAAKKGVEMKLVECRYQGSRYKHPNPMNVSALHQMFKHWTEVIGGLSFLREIHIGNKPAGEVTLLDFWKIAKAGALLPTYLVYRAKEALGAGDIPAFVAAIYKASLGLFNTIQDMVISGVFRGERGDRAIVNPDAVLYYADKQKTLIGPQEVCAGPPHAIKAAILAITHGDNNSSGLKLLIHDKDKFLTYVTQIQILDLLNFTFPIISYFALTDLYQMARIYTSKDCPIELINQFSLLERNASEECRRLKSLGTDVSMYFIESLATFISILDSQSGAASAIRRAARPNEQEVKDTSDKLRGLLGEARANIMVKFSDLALKGIFNGLAKFLLVERERLRLQAPIQSAVNFALDRNDLSHLFTGHDLSPIFGRNIRNMLSEIFQVQIINYCDKTEIDIESRKMII